MEIQTLERKRIQKIVVTDVSGNEFIFDSVIACALKLHCSRQMIYTALKGNAKVKGCRIKKIVEV